VGSPRWTTSATVQMRLRPSKSDELVGRSSEMPPKHPKFNRDAARRQEA
jgi:hypothetical protein